ncbi:acyl-CoA N-acyltransferase [Cercophora newfieldiana]|uniref:histone acetyltransferase n=1 Tax=Cercophora newfieldiana TaxID=92897 RepID=A0AA39YE93_9PEZI|nr:acyl-CoA N-acyltransferase [Cercophora newfieldiana]
MAPLKRKRPHETTTAPSQPRKTTAVPLPVIAPSSPPISRRATRSIAPLAVQQELPPIRRRRRLKTNGPLPIAVTATNPAPEPPRGKENIFIDQKQKRLTRNGGPSSTVIRPPSRVGADTKRPAPTFTPVPVPVIPPQAERIMRPVQRDSSKPAGLTNGRTPGRSPLVLPPHTHTVGRSKPITMATSGTQPQQSPTPSAPGPPGGPEHHGRAVGGGHQQQESDRNIDKVVLGDICFRAWYPSYYGKEVLGEGAGSNGSHAKGGKDGKGRANGGLTPNGTNGGGCKDDTNGGKAHGRRERDSTPMLDRLYVCPCCFKYSKELVTWWEHVRVCERRGVIPGDKIYTHPKGQRTVLVPSAPPPKPARGKRASGGQKIVEEVVQDQGEWTIWEIDGAKDVLFCQNLSLFAKLFLDNKSVFFDVTGFNYFLLVYTPATPPPTDPDTDVAEVIPARSQIVGFFSKEKMSWDNNNLACILIFPPWQRKGLGALLMGVSYEISRREGVMGGPEKPISDLGKKGYKRFWAGEIARWLLTLNGKRGEETVVDVNDCSTATWIAPEDCLLVLREMGVAEDAGKGPPPVRKKIAVGEENGAAAMTSTAVGAAAPTAEPEGVQRVRISLQAVKAWIARNKISLERTCDPAGFVEGYAMKPLEEEEDEEM